METSAAIDGGNGPAFEESSVGGQGKQLKEGSDANFPRGISVRRICAPSEIIGRRS